METLNELVTTLKELNPKFLQGYLFTQPCVPEQFEEIYFGEISDEFRKRLDTYELYYLNRAGKKP